jgi:SM-20-related protein
VPGYVDGPEWRGLAAEGQRLHRHGGFRHAGIGRGASLRLAPEVRDDRVRWIDPSTATRRQRGWLARMEALRRILNERLLLGLFGFETHLACYPPGARYRTHRDRFADAAHRTVSVLLYLNEDWRAEQGGALRIYHETADQPPWTDVTPVGGTLVAFLSDAFPHEVLPAIRERWSAVGWFGKRR